MKPLIFLFTLISISCQAQEVENKTLWTAAWSPDDKHIAIGGSEGVLKIYSGADYELDTSYTLGDVIISRVKWHPEQNKLAVITQSSTFKTKILDLNKSSWIELQGLKDSFRGIDWNHDGSLLAISGGEGEILVFDSVGNRIADFLADDKSVTGIDWHPSENKLTAVGSTIGIFNAHGDSLYFAQPRDVEVVMLCVEWHPSGKFFATGDYGEFENADSKLLQIWSHELEKLVEFGDSNVEYRNIRWNHDGTVLATANDALRLWNTKGELLHESAPSSDYLWGIDWNSDGTRIITTSDQGVISLWDEKATLIKRIDN